MAGKQAFSLTSVSVRTVGVFHDQFAAHGSDIMGVETTYGFSIQRIKDYTTGMSLHGSWPAFNFIIPWWNFKGFWNFLNGSDGERLTGQKHQDGTAEEPDEHAFRINFFHERIWKELGKNTEQVSSNA